MPNIHTQRYRDIRGVLTRVMRSMPELPERTRPSITIQMARHYLQGHCAECGSPLDQCGYAIVHAQEMLRIGTSVASDVAQIPICPDCYTARCLIRQGFAPQQGE
jgi:hypothetical protein